MAYGSGAYGSTTYGGSANSVNEQIFFPVNAPNLDPDTLYEASALFSGPEEWYEVLTRQGSEPGSGPVGTEYKIYTSPQEGITPQLQATVGGNAQTIVAAAPIIVVTALIDGAVWPSGLDISVRGRPYTQ